jgi:hypothetical protein
MYLLSEADEKYPKDGPALITASRNNLRDLLEEVRAGEAMLLELEKGAAEEAVAAAAEAAEAAKAAKAEATLRAVAVALEPEPDDDECSVCLENIAGRELQQIKGCTHCFCEHCLCEMIADGKKHCPLCRGALDGYHPLWKKMRLS